LNLIDSTLRLSAAMFASHDVIIIAVHFCTAASAVRISPSDVMNSFLIAGEILLITYI
jgi:hypothetical protein